MNSSENPQAATVVSKQSIVFRLWLKLLAKRKNNFSIRVLCIVLISIATVMTWIIRLFLEFMAVLPEAVMDGVAETAKIETMYALYPPHVDRY